MGKLSFFVLYFRIFEPSFGSVSSEGAGVSESVEDINVSVGSSESLSYPKVIQSLRLGQNLICVDCDSNCADWASLGDP